MRVRHLVLAAILLAVPRIASSGIGWVYSLEPVSGSVFGCAMHEVLGSNSPTMPGVTRTVPGLFLSVEVLSGAIGLEFRNRVGVGVGLRLAELGLIVASRKALYYAGDPSAYLAAVNLGPRLYYRLGKYGDASPISTC